jgi:tRNA threonylcarbamoyladenosine biosynthesis protein TsaE
MRDAWTTVTRSADETRRLAAALGRAVDPVPRGGLTVALLGDLGAGKTTFAQGLLEGLGVPPGTAVVSPTFTFARAYLGRMPVHHVDAYHVRDLASLEASGFEEMGGEGRVTVVEWADRIARALPSDRIEVDLSGEPGPDASPQARRVEVRARGPASARVLEAVAARRAG